MKLKQHNAQGYGLVSENVVVGWKAAQEIGARFYQGSPCRRGHDGLRYTRGSVCVLCTRERNAEKAGRPFDGVGSRAKANLARAVAAQENATTYVSGKPCPRGHLVRFTASTNCVQCAKDIAKRDREGQRWNRRKRLYGIGKSEFFDLLIAQDGECPICREQLPEPTRVHIDHCHTTGRVRGLLCGPCNQAIGLFKENTERMRRAINYVCN